MRFELPGNPSIVAKTIGCTIRYAAIALLAISTTNDVAAMVIQDQETGRKSEVMVDRTFDVNEGELLQVSVPDADLVLERSNGSQAHVVITLEGRDMEKAREYYEKQMMAVSYSDGAVKVVSERKKRNVSFNWSWNSNNRARILVTVAIPEMFDVDLATSDGDITAGTVRGHIAVRTSDGDIEAVLLAGPEVSLKSSDGDISVKTISSPTVLVRTSDGDIGAEQVSSETAEFITSDGDIRISAIEGSSILRTSDGDISVDESTGRSLQARTSDGDLKVGQLSAVTAKVHTSDGSIRINGLNGELDASTSDGDIFVRFNQPSAANIRASDGDIVLVGPGGLEVDIDLSGERVRLASDFAFRGRVQKRSASGSLNGGGPVVKARTSGGTLYFRTKE